MKFDETDDDQSFFGHTSTKVDKSIGYVLACLFIVFFFSVFLFGMARVHSVSSRVTGGDHSQLATGESHESREEPSDNVGIR